MVRSFPSRLIAAFPVGEHVLHFQQRRGKGQAHAHATEHYR